MQIGRTATPLASARLFGRFELRGSNGEDLTPQGSSRAQAILALLLLSPGFERSREYLIDKLWSTRATEQGARSLKTELYVIRRALGAQRSLLVSQSGMVRLDPHEVARDIDAPGFLVTPDRELCEGLTVNDPEFTDWLEEQRRGLASSEARLRKPRLILRAESDGARLQQSVLAGGFQQTLADWCAEQLVQGDEGDTNFASEETDPAAFLLDQVLAEDSGQVAASSSLTRRKDSRQLWHRIDHMPAGANAFLSDPAAYRAINSSVDQTIYEVAPPGSTSAEARYLERGAIGAIRLLFRNQGDDLALARQRLTANFDLNPSGIYLAWSAYSLAFLKGEAGLDEADLRDEAEELARRAIEMEPHNSMVLALTSYVHTYLLAAPAYGVELADRATDVNRANPLAWAFKAAALYTLGEYERAHQVASFARAISGNGPYRYAVETYSCIAATLSDNLDDAIRAGEAAYRLKPDFRASLRYLAILYAHKGDDKRLQDVLSKLRRAEPDFSIQKMLEASSYPSEILRTAPIVMRDR